MRRTGGVVACVLAAAGCGPGAAAGHPAAPAAEPARVPPAAAAPATADDDRALQQAREDVAQAQRNGDAGREVTALHAYATLLKDRASRLPGGVADDAAKALVAQRAREAGATYCAALRRGSAVTDPAERERLTPQLHTIGDDLRNHINRELTPRAEHRRIDLDTAFAWYEHYHGAMAAAGQEAAAAQIRHNMAALALDGQRTAQALEWADEAIAIRRRLLRGGAAPEFIGPLAWSLSLRGHALFTLERLDEAIDAYDTALATLRPAEGDRLLTDVGQRCIDGLAQVATALIAAGRTERALRLWRGGYQFAEKASIGHREAWLHHATRLHAKAGDVAGAVQAAELLVKVNALRTPPRRDIEATLRYDLAQLLLEHGDDLDRALAAADAAADIQRDIGWDLALGWSRVLRGKILLTRAGGAVQAHGAFDAARALFEQCGQARDGLTAAYQGLRDAARARGDEQDAAIWDERLRQLLESAPPAPLERASFAPADEFWRDLWDRAEAGAPVVAIVRDTDGTWLLIDVLDSDRPKKRIPFDWGWREIDVREARFALAGDMILANRFKLFRPRGEGAMFLRAGAVVPWPVRMGDTHLEPVLSEPVKPPPKDPKKPK